MPATSVRRAVAVALGAAVLLTACGGDPEATPSGPGPRSTVSATASATAQAAPEEPAEPALLPGVVEALPDGTLTEVGRIEVRKTGTPASGGGLSNGGFVWTDDAVVMVTELGRVIAIDRATGEQRWSARLPAPADPIDDFVCLTPTPPPGATAVTVLAGFSCQLRVAFDLATGEQLSTQTMPDGSTQDSAQVGDWTYAAGPDGTLLRLERDGSTSSLDALDLPAGQVAELLLAEGDVLIVKTKSAENVEIRTATGRFVGFRLTATDESTTAERLWDVSVKDVVGPVTSAGVFTDDGWLGDGAVFVNGLPGSATGDVQISRLDPETGALAGRVRVPSDDPEGFPEWADNFAGVGTTLLAGSTVYALARNQAEVRSIVRYDLASGESTWRWVPKRSRGLFQDVDPVAVSPDGSRVYVTAGSGFDKLALVELDAASGTQLRSWRVPEALADEIYFGTFSIDDGQVIAFDSLYILAQAASGKKSQFVLSLLDLS